MEKSNCNITSFSVYVENNLSSSPSNDTLIANINKIYPKESKKWINSNSINNCHNCLSNFGLFIRKHHCRACGLVFCSYCCNKYINIPANYINIPKEDKNYYQSLSNLSKWVITGTTTDTSLVCNVCYNKIKNLQEIKNQIEFIEIISPHIFKFLDLNSLKNCMFLSKKSYNIAIHFLSKFREIQYEHETEIYTDWKKTMLINSLHLLQGHTCWYPFIIESFIQNYYEKYVECEIKNHKTYFNFILNYISKAQKNKSCLLTMCSRKCGLKLDVINFIDILNFSKSFERTASLKNINIYDDTIFTELNDFLTALLKLIFTTNNEYYMQISKLTIPLLISTITNLNEYNLKNQLINVILQFEYLRFEIIKEYCYLEKYFFKKTKNQKNIKMENDEFNKMSVIMCILNNCLENYEYKIGYNIYTLNDIRNKMLDLSYFSASIINNDTLGNYNYPIIYPFDSNYVITNVINKNQISSKTKPYEVSLELLNCTNNTIENKKIIVKNDTSLRKESLIANLISILQYKLYLHICKKNIDNFELIPSYQIAIISNNTGIIEFVENSATLRKINNQGQTIQNYILEKSQDELIKTIKHRFAKSLAVSCCLSYILGLGDRHLDNIMINNKGQIFHIDYGYLMDNPATTILTEPRIKITGLMIDFLGGENSEFYNLFKKYTVKIYDILRLHVDSILSFYEMLSKEKHINWEKFKDKIENRFMIGMACKDVQIILQNEIESSITYNSVITETCQDLKQKYFGF